MLTNDERKKLNDLKIRELFLKILVLDFQENVIREITGVSTGGNININGNSSLRRTINLNMIASVENNNLENLNNLISLNKKIKIEIGIKLYPSEEILWFQQGVFIVSSANLNITTTSASINIQAKDKMCKLNGIAGGTFPATIIFHEYEEVQKDGSIILKTPTIYEIIREAVHEYGEELYEKIQIYDLDIEASQVVKYNGKFEYISFRQNYSECIESDQPVENYPLVFKKGDNIGYLKVPLTFPGELQFSAGQTVTALLDKIVQILGNYEYYYDLQGNFIFQKKKNYLNNNITSLDTLINDNYVQLYPEDWFAEIIDDNEAFISFNNSPKYENIKNDFIVWGQRKSSTGTVSQIRYHLAIDSKPQIFYANKYMYKNTQSATIYYEFFDEELKEPEKYRVLIGYPSKEWREELYRQALVRQSLGDTSGFYDEELLAEWRKIYDTQAEWAYKSVDGWEGWNPKVKSDPTALDYWLDFLDSYENLQEYSVKSIGRRTKILQNEQCSTLLNIEIPEVFFIENPSTFEEKQELMEKYEFNKVNYLFVSPDFKKKNLAISTAGASAYDLIKELLYQYLVYNTSISFNCLPKYYLEPNTLIYINNKQAAIQGRFVINQITIPLNYNGTMSVQATQALSQL